MPWVQTWVKTAAQAFTAGVSRLTHWLFGSGRSQFSILDELQQRYPSMPQAPRTQVYGRMERAAELGEQFSQTGVFPDARTIPRDPSFASQGRYRYDIDYDAIGRPSRESTARPMQFADRFFFHYADRPLTLDEIRLAALQHLQEQLSYGTLLGGGGEDPIITDLLVNVVAIYRSD